MVFLLAVIYVVFISLGLPDSLFGVAWPLAHYDFSVDEGFASVFSMIVGACTGGVSFVSGPLIRRFGTGKVTFFSTLLTAVGLVGISFSPNIAVMMLFSVILGYGAGAIDTGLNNFVSLHYKSQHMNWLHCFWGVGVTVSPLIMSAFLSEDTSSWRNGYRIVALLQLAVAIFVLFALKKWKAVEEGSRLSDQTEENEQEGKNIFDLLKMKGVVTSILSLGFYCSMEFLIGTWGASFAVNVFSLPADTAAKWVSLYYGGIMLGRMISGFVSMKASDNTLIRAGLGFSFLGMVILALPLGSAQLFGLLLIGIGFGPIFPCVLHSVPERFSKKYSADLTGYHMGGAYAVGFAFQLIYGFVATRTSFSITAFVLMLFCLCAFLCNEHTIKMGKRK